MKIPILRAAAVLAIAAAAACTQDRLIAPPDSPRALMQPPELHYLSPEDTPARDDSLVLRIVGRYFDDSATVRWNGRTLTPRWVGFSVLEVWLREPEIGAGDSVEVRVHTPEGGESLPLRFDVYNPVPRLDSLSHDTLVGGSGNATLRLWGAGFVRTSTVTWGGVPIPARRIDSGTLEATVDAALLAQAGARSVAVENGAPGGGATGAQTVVVTVPPPVLTGLSTRGVNGPGAFTLGIHGKNLFPQTLVFWNGYQVPATYVGPGRMRASIPAGAASSGFDYLGRGRVQVITPGAGLSDTLQTRYKPVPYNPPPPTVATVTAPATDLAYSAASGRLYAAVESASGYPNGAVLVIDPATAAVVGTYATQGRPRSIALSRDGRVLWIAADQGLQRIRVPEGTALPGLSVQSSPVDLEVSPDSANLAAVARTYVTSLAGIGDAGAVRPGTMQGTTGTAATGVEFGEGAALWGWDRASGTLRRMRAAAFPLPDTAATGLIPAGARDVAYAAGRVYAASGDVVDTAPIQRLGACPGQGWAALPDPATGRIFVLRSDGILVCDLNTFQQLGMIWIMPTLSSFSARRYQVVRWGTDGLALFDEQRIYILRTPYAGP